MSGRWSFREQNLTTDHRPLITKYEFVKISARRFRARRRFVVVDRRFGDQIHDARRFYGQSRALFVRSNHGRGFYFSERLKTEFIHALDFPPVRRHALVFRLRQQNDDRRERDLSAVHRADLHSDPFSVYLKGKVSLFGSRDGRDLSRRDELFQKPVPMPGNGPPRRSSRAHSTHHRRQAGAFPPARSES